jgi:hypothetical protein
MWETCNEPTPEQDQAAVQLVTWYIPMLNVDGYEKVREGVLSQLGPHCCNYHAAACRTGARKQRWVMPNVTCSSAVFHVSALAGRACQRRASPPATCAPPSAHPRPSASKPQNQRANGGNADLNRDFPQVLDATAGLTQPESKAFVDFAREHPFDVSLMYHGGGAYHHSRACGLLASPGATMRLGPRRVKGPALSVSRCEQQAMPHRLTATTRFA